MHFFFFFFEPSLSFDTSDWVNWNNSNSCTASQVLRVEGWAEHRRSVFGSQVRFIAEWVKLTFAHSQIIPGIPGTLGWKLGSLEQTYEGAI